MRVESIVAILLLTFTGILVAFKTQQDRDPLTVLEGANRCGDGMVMSLPNVTPENGVVELTVESTHGVLESNNVRKVRVGQDGLFIGHAGEQEHNVQLFTGTTIENCGSSEVPITSHVNDILQTVIPNEIYVCTDWNSDTMEGGGVFRYDGEKWYHYTEAEGLPATPCYDLYPLGVGQVVATTLKGIGAFIPDINRWDFQDGVNNREGVLEVHTFIASGHTAPGMLYMYGTIRNGVYMLFQKPGRNAEWSHITMQDTPALGSNNTRSIAMDTEGCYWIISDPGITTYCGSEWLPVLDIPNNQGTDISFDYLGRPWVTTHGGTFRLECNKWVTVTEHDSMTISFGVEGGEFDERNFFIATTDNGVLWGQVPEPQVCS